MPTFPELRRPLRNSLAGTSRLGSASSTPAKPPRSSAPTHPRHGDVSLAYGRYEFLDALRGLAALFVGIQHSLELLGLGSTARQTVLSPHLPVNLGETGVVLFFLVSGCVIPPSIERHGSLASFWRKRVFRLFPAYWASLAGCLGLVAVGLFPPPFIAMRRPALGAAINLTMLQSFFGVPSAIGAYWTLPLELLFYLLCSVLFRARLLARPLLCLFAGTAALLAAELAAASRHTSVPAGRLGLLLVALFGSVVLHRLEARLSRHALLAAALALSAVVALGLWLRFDRFPVAHEVAAPGARVVLLSWLLAAGLFWAAVSLRARSLPPALLSLGRISYSFYLWHIPVIVVLAAERHRHGLDTTLPGWVLLPTALGVTVLVAKISFQRIELPGIRLGSRGEHQRTR